MTVLTPHRVRKHTTGLLAGTLEYHFPDANSDGHYELVDPALGREMHQKKKAVYTNGITAALHLVRTYGFSIRMRGNLTGQRNLIRAEEIQDL